MSPLFQLQNHCSTRAVQLLVQVFRSVFHSCTCGVPRSTAYKSYTHSAMSSCSTCCLLLAVYSMCTDMV
jgi:hypothetical protein